METKTQEGSSKKVIIIAVVVVLALCICSAICIVIGAALTNQFSRTIQNEVDKAQEQLEESIKENDELQEELETYFDEDEIAKKLEELKEIYDNDDTDFSTFPPAEANVDDDPVMGDLKEAKLVMIEFGDYECPFCKRHFEEVYPSLITDYVDKGTLAIVFRDFPLAFHDPAATREALAAECVDDLSNDDAYFEYHNLIFKNTPGNGTGLSSGKLTDLAEELGIDSDSFSSCLNTSKFSAEIQKDIEDGSEAGVEGTPSFVIGYLKTDGTVTGVRIDGAYPLSSFEEAITTLLEQ